MNPQDITIATITLARNKGEETELIAALQQLALLNMPVIITDGGSTASFLEFINSIPHFTVLPYKVGGVWPQAKASLEAAGQTRAPFIFYTEPDKKEFFSKWLLTMVEETELTKKSGVVIASRTAEGFASFPAFQQITETTINTCCSEIIGKKGDYCYGPFLLNQGLVPYLDAVKEDIGWGWRPFVFGMSHRLGYTVQAFEKNFFCPPQQRADDSKERIYRMKQLEQNIRGLVLATTTEL